MSIIPSPALENTIYITHNANLPTDMVAPTHPAQIISNGCIVETIPIKRIDSILNTIDITCDFFDKLCEIVNYNTRLEKIIKFVIYIQIFISKELVVLCFVCNMMI